MTKVVDPLGGSYYIEALTNELVEKAWEIIARVEADLDLPALAGQRVHLTRALVQQPKLLLKQDARGWNLLRAVAAKTNSEPSTGPATKNPWRVELQALDLVGRKLGQDGGKQQRYPQDARRQRAVELVAVEPEVEEHERGDAEQRHRRDRFERPQLGAPVRPPGELPLHGREAARRQQLHAHAGPRHVRR
jgi:hypothetical protein